MRATVLFVLAFAGATCALQLPSIPSPESALNAGSSILGNIPGIKPRADDSSSSSSSSSSEEDQNTASIANDLAERLVDDVFNVAGGVGSVAVLPLKVGTALFKTLLGEIRNFLTDVLHPENLKPGAPTVPELAIDLAQSVVRDIEKVAGSIGSALLEPVKLKAQLVQTIAHEIEESLKKVQNRQPGPSPPQHRPQPVDKPGQRPQPANLHHRPTSQRPRPTPSGQPSSQRPRPTPSGRPSSQRPRPTPSGRPSSERPRPTPSGRPSSERPRPTPSGRPSSERPRPTPTGRPSSERPRPTPTGRPSSERPRPTPTGRPSSERPRPTPTGRPSSERPRPTPTGPPSTVPPTSPTPTDGPSSPLHTPVLTVSKEIQTNVRVARDVDLSISGGISFEQLVSDSKVRNLGSALASVDIKIVKPIPRIPDLTPLSKLVLPGLEAITRRARNLVIHAIAAGAPTIEEAIQTALSVAVASVNPAAAIVNLVNIILQMYFFVAQTALAPVAAALLKEAAVVVGSLVSSLLYAMSENVADGVRALLN